ncbi:MAG: adenylate/guanylate cyclase domain-containing protein [Alphaproteobacteria bacterium]|nr:adenylate/guanylate cyclase domain-containing protein [Alphaproteobacteria bacterium]
MRNEISLSQPVKLFAEAELQAERTVAQLRVVIAIVLGIVFLFAVLRASPAGEPILIRQWLFAGGTMLAYLLLGLASFFAIANGVYRPWMAWLVVTGDSAFLLINIWLGLINTGLPPNYLTSMPPIWLAPVVLAFGALRFNPLLQAYLVFILVAGLLAIAISAGGWVYSLDAPPPSGVNIFFALPPNVMRLAMLALAGFVLVIASMRARTLLTLEINEARRSSNLTRYLPQQIADRLADTGIDELRRGRRQNIAVLFVDIRGFTRRSEAMSPEALGEFLTEFRSRIARAAETSGGTIDKFIGDAAMVVFGLVPNGRNEAAAAVECADLILADIEKWNRQHRGSDQEPVKVGIGIHWGDAFCGAIGDERRLEYTVLGDTVNVAARLEELTKQTAWPVIVSGDVLEEAGHSGDSDIWQPLETTTLRGRSDPIQLFGSSGFQNLP